MECKYCKKDFIEKKALSSCADCETCSEICDRCQSYLNKKQKEITERLKSDPSNFSLPMEVKFISVESSREYPFLIKETFEGANTKKNIESYYF
jgi:hypothetical protein